MAHVHIHIHQPTDDYGVPGMKKGVRRQDPSGSRELAGQRNKMASIERHGFRHVGNFGNGNVAGSASHGNNFAHPSKGYLAVHHSGEWNHTAPSGQTKTGSGHQSLQQHLRSLSKGQ